eukprot:gb/GEZN01012740.1/.p1 GENE.gb/GEZN01012740.1/~~gb/GEZN01012740.1/.p1  ORF type:complete len:178 (-),score=32.94 gb/GEZN01012740.1/:480-1013(-)
MGKRKKTTKKKKKKKTRKNVDPNQPTGMMEVDEGLPQESATSKHPSQKHRVEWKALRLTLQDLTNQRRKIRVRTPEDKSRKKEIGRQIKDMKSQFESKKAAEMLEFQRQQDKLNPAEPQTPAELLHKASLGQDLSAISAFISAPSMFKSPVARSKSKKRTTKKKQSKKKKQPKFQAS